MTWMYSPLRLLQKEANLLLIFPTPDDLLRLSAHGLSLSKATGIGYATNKTAGNKIAHLKGKRPEDIQE